MSPVARLTSNLLSSQPASVRKIALLVAFIGGALISSGCSTATEKLEKRLKVGEPVAQVYYGKYEEIEAALKQAMFKYPQRIDNTEAGIFETDYVKGTARFQPPHQKLEYSSGYRYRIVVRLVKGKSVARPAVKVLVVKQIEIFRDFFAQPEPMPSDGLEENVILYRIGRELMINRAFQKANKNSDSDGES